MKQVENSVAEIGLPTQGIVEKTGGLVGVENIGAVPAPELVFFQGCRFGRREALCAGQTVVVIDAVEHIVHVITFLSVAQNLFQPAAEEHLRYGITG